MAGLAQQLRVTPVRGTTTPVGHDVIAEQVHAGAATAVGLGLAIASRSAPVRQPP
ncbi:hypothetical protein [Mycobacteroides abscessus]|uniref:hypothetical protein n=1 Tax=Mycobacteroides abscessus TaxID=36809 RepID=UPI001F1FB61B|nr:hypothetical protein [Mycobacteroides abscessus]MDM2600697.1 hypothetical protein [Mycobacteroides abscessus]MDM2612820.1 hypothetical protein [Mycobacteroides abscessus]MDM2617786.1 hypothetical protein [Mycobacteroides abscessus]MDM2622623.1 hypothetical protein [Mycobacteroides abscessus]MDM2627514.1 hypothetical protein [Mycobacteroides abscessus]